MSNVSRQVVEKPARTVLVKRGVTADDYFAYCEEVGCDVWNDLLQMVGREGEPVCLWLPEAYVKPDTSVYVQGVEVGDDYQRPIPDGYDRIDLPAATYLQFQGEPFAEEDYGEAIVDLQATMDQFVPAKMGLAWDDSHPRIQLEPRGERGYIEFRAVKKLP